MTDQHAERLRDHDRFVRTLARTLVRDPAIADDLAQEAWLAAVRQGPATIRNLRGWLRTALLRGAALRHRGDARRQRREAALPTPDAAPAADAVCQRLQEQRLLLDAVDRLDEPYRTVIVLRFFEQLPPRAIARRVQAPVETVRTRLQRALARLRHHLDDRCGSRAAWLLPFAAWSRPPVATWLALGLTMHTHAKVLLAAAAIATCALSLHWLAAPPPAVPETALATDSTGRPAASAPLAMADIAHRRAAPPSSTEPAPGSDTAAPADAVPLRGLVLTVDGAPLAGVRVGRRGPGERTTTDASGRFSLPGDPRRGALVVDDPAWRTLLNGEATGSREQERVLVVGPAIAVSGRVLDTDGRPVRGARLHYRLPGDFRGALPAAIDLAFSSDEYVNTESGDDGSFDLRGCARVTGSALEVHHDAYRPLHRGLDGDTVGITIVLERPQLGADVVQGIVVDDRDLPVVAAAIAAGRTATASDDRGEFRLPRAEIAGRRIVASKLGMMPAVVQLPEASTYLRLQLRSQALMIRGTVVDAAGLPLVGAKVWAADPTFLGAADGFDSSCEGIAGGGGGLAAYRADNSALADLSAEDAAARRQPTALWCFVRTDAAGHFGLGGLADRAYRLRAQAPRTLQTIELGPFAAGSTDVVLAMPPDGVFHRVVGRVVDDLDRPIAHASVEVMVRTMRLPIDEHTVTHRSELRAETATDADGRFDLADIPAQALIAVRGDRVEPSFFGGEDDPPFASQAVGAVTTAHVELLLRCSARCPVRIEVPATTGADAVAFEDDRGQRLPVLRLEGTNVDEAPTAVLTAGRSVPLQVSGRAAIVVLLRQGTEVARIPVRVTPGQETIVRQ